MNPHFEPLLEYLNSIYPLSEQLRQDLAERLIYRKYSKKELVLREGEINNYIYFVKSGTLRAYYEKDGEDMTSWLMTAGDVIISVYSFFTRKPSSECIETLKESELVFMHYDDLNRIYNKHVEFNVVGRKLTEYYYMKSEERAFFMRRSRAIERYEFLEKNYPQIILEVPGKYIASYLGMTIETLSRIRNSRIN
ncbi:Crp/Fnr family transcriptional regulator [Chitinophaga vietnamensis]|uniref:Crp/Fnr family transcriptional regulator n=1 Tax=Chitinophaga vietnamensis TaxID=2593957 RepID=UPI0011774000|nr:Crp/Fnr family transcriptional regulator [Chitinophaga vietnamensis]